MFDQPKRSTFTAPPPNFDLDQRYIVKLTKLTDEGVSPFADPAKNETFHQIAWSFNVAHGDTKQPIYGEDGQPWVYTEETTSKTGKNPKNGMVAKARQYIEALMGRPMEQDEASATRPEDLIGKLATALFEMSDRKAQDGTSYQRLQIMRLSPFKAAVGAPAPPPPPPPPQQPQEDPFAGIA